jgi:oligopeptide/dipeptide ABC transporter ATP-binding protein
MAALLEVKGLEVAYHTHKGPLKALFDVNFEVQAGEIVGIVGESGCGKSTVASALLRLLPPNGEILSGEMLFKGRDLMKLSPAELRSIRGQEIAMIFQDPTTSLNPVFTISTQMRDIQNAHIEAIHQNEKVDLKERAVEFLRQVGIPDAEDRIDTFPHQFSGGMRQRIMIAIALMSKPGLLIADEPTSSLDVTMEAQILELIKQLRQKYQTSILFISHDLGVIANLCDRVVVMYTGRVVEQGDVVTIFEQPKHPYTRALLRSVPSRQFHGERLMNIPGRVPSLFNLPPGCKFADRCSFTQPVCQQQEPRFLSQDGGAIRCHYYDPASGYDGGAWEQGAAPSPASQAAEVSTERDEARDMTKGQSLLRLENLTTYFYDEANFLDQILGRRGSPVHAVDGVNLEILRGEIVGLVGESGCGKTTLGRTILNLVTPASGKTYYDGADIAQLSPADLRKLRGRIQMIFQDPFSSLSPRSQVAYLLTEPYKIHHIPAAQQYSVAELLEMVELPSEIASKYQHELSGGQARRVGIARALALRPEFLIADEPTSGLDVSVAASILNLMKDLAGRLNLTYLVITHNLNVVGYFADRVAVMYLGKLVEMGRTKQVFESPAHPYTLALLSAISEPNPRQRRESRRLFLSGEIPSPKNLPPGCRFYSRCSFVGGGCEAGMPEMVEVSPGHIVACPNWYLVHALEPQEQRGNI